MTLLEALVVVTLTVMLGLIAFPSMERTYEILMLRQTAEVLAANLRVAHADAIDKSRDVEFSIQVDGHGYGWNEGEARRVPVAIDLRMSKGQTIQFFADGSTSGGAVTLASGAHQVDISVDVATGAVSDGQ
jgi:general secretion pathway protein H